MSDSVASALILREHGFNVVGLFMMNWNPYIEAVGGHCSESELSAVRSLCGPKGLDVPLKLIGFDGDYFNAVFVDFIESLSAGFCTPNPDSHCARRIAFGELHRFADTLNLDYVATGHYASTQWTETPHGYRPSLKQSAERRYDQSYFLSRIDREALRRHLFPIGAHFKSKQQEVRSVVARHFGSKFAAKRSSTGLCYVDGSGVDGSFRSFMGQFVDRNVGVIVDAFGRTLGLHNGLWLWTIGQRLKADEPEDGRHRFNRLAFTLYIARNVALYVLDKDAVRNELVVATECHSKLNNEHIVGWKWNWLCDQGQRQSNGDIVGRFRFRDKDALIPGVVRFDRERPDFGHIHLTQGAVRAATPGQVVAMYDDDDICICSALIHSVRR